MVDITTTNFYNMKNKYILHVTILTIFLSLYSCKKDNSNTPQYLDNKLIEGTWFGRNGPKDSTLYKFRNDTAYYEFWTFVGGMDNLKYGGLDSFGEYHLTDTAIITSFPSTTYPYKHVFYYRLSENKDSIYIRRQLQEYYDVLKKIAD